jgi:hypothetical protein
MENREPSGKIEDADDEQPCPMPDWIRDTVWQIAQLPAARRRAISTDVAAVLVMRSVESEAAWPPMVAPIPDPYHRGRYGLALQWDHAEKRLTLEFHGHRLTIRRFRGDVEEQTQQFTSVLPTRWVRDALAWLDPTIFGTGSYRQWCDGDGTP